MAGMARIMYDESEYVICAQQSWQSKLMVLKCCNSMTLSSVPICGHEGGEQVLWRDSS